MLRFGKTVAALLVVLTACAAPPGDVTMARSPGDALPTFAADVLPVTSASPLPPQRSNAEMAADFLDLEFQMESGRRLPRLTRFEGPVTIGFEAGGFADGAPKSAAVDLGALVHRIRSEAGVDLILAVPGQFASITLIFSTRAALRKIVPSAACFVVPGAASLADYQARRGSRAMDWAEMTSRSRAVVLIPVDTTPQEIRDCLHEEVAQALGPLNDLYRLPDSVFNDDNFQSVLTGFDMLMLRVHYAPELANGMSEAEVAARLPAIFARLNPAGASGPAPVARNTSREWLTLVASALGPASGDKTLRLDAARRVLAMAQAQGWQDSRLGFAWFALGQAEVSLDAVAARVAYEQAHMIYAALPDRGIHAAHVAMQLAALELSLGDLDRAMAWVQSAGPALDVAQNPALSATLRLIEAEIEDLRGKAAQAQALRLDSAADARYGFGADWLDARAAEIVRLGVRGQQS